MERMIHMVLTSKCSGKPLDCSDRYMASKSAASGAVVTRRDIKCMLGLRESARLVAIARKTGCVIQLAAGKKSGTTESMLSLIQMGLREGTSVVLSIQGMDSRAAFHECVKVLDGQSVDN